MSTPSPDDSRNRLERILGDSIECALELKNILEDERSALEQQDIVALTETAAVKEKYIRQLQELETQRSKVSTDSGFDAEPAEMPALARWCDDDSLIIGSWRHLMEIARRCSELNLTNGAIIRMRRHQIDSSLSILRGSHFEADTYGPRGVEATSFGRQRLADA